MKHPQHIEQWEALNKKLDVIQRDQPDQLRQAIASYELVKEVMLSPDFQKNDNSPQYRKNTYSLFLSKLIYFQEIAHALAAEPLGRKAQLRYFKKLRKKIAVFKDCQEELIRYCRSGATHHDETYFGWNATQSPIAHQTPVYRWSTYLAHEKLYAFYTEAIAQRKKITSPNDLKWTGPKANLIELLYALQATGVLNEGKCDLKQLAEAFEKIFQVSLGNYYRVFQDLRLRKISQTAFLDLLKEKFLQRVSELE